MLSTEVEATLLTEGDEAGTAPLTADCFVVPCFVPSAPVVVLEPRPTGDSTTAPLVFETLALLAVGLVTTEGNEVLLSSGRDRLTAPGAEGDWSFLPPAVPTLLFRADVFWAKPPVLFLLVAGTEFEVFPEGVPADLLMPESESDTLLGSIFFLLDKVGLANPAVSTEIAFALFATDFGVSLGVRDERFSELAELSTAGSLKPPSGSSISAQHKAVKRSKGKNRPR